MRPVAYRPYEQLSCAVEDRVLRVTLNRPDQLNAFTPTMAAEFEDVPGFRPLWLATCRRATRIGWNCS